jgi:RHH-type proline utilization regulon transcriptional repressor/proline dehydrogenase/delta 1-pyrroline-5-carboxylate dehydrogenase
MCVVSSGVSEREPPSAVIEARTLLSQLRGQSLDDAAHVAHALKLAALLMEGAEAHTTDADAERAALLARLMADPRGLLFTTCLTDRVYRSRTPEQIVGQAVHLLDRLGVPQYLPRLARLQLRALKLGGRAAAGAAAAGLLKRLRSETEGLIVAADGSGIAEHIRERAAAGVRLNLNQLGEAVLGEEEAEARTDAYVKLLGLAELESVSVKVSSLCGVLDLSAFEATLARLAPRLRRIYRAALRRRGPAVLVNLDMESFRDLAITVELFERVLGEAEFQPLTAGVVLQAYLPDSHAYQARLNAWARARVAAGGAPVRLRVVKGANLATERVEAGLSGWPVPVYPDKLAVDASFKRMLHVAMEPAHAAALRVGVASHNVFDLAYALVLRSSRGVEAQVSFELLEGMAEPLLATVGAVAGSVLAYCPVVPEAEMQTAIAYLMRRLDENTSPENFLHHSFGMRAGTPAWERERVRFEAACAARVELSTASRRTQDRSLPPRAPEPVPEPGAHFVNEPDTDFSLEPNRRWLTAALQALRTRSLDDVVSRIAGRDEPGEHSVPGFDPSRPGVVPYRLGLSGAESIERALDSSARLQAQGARPASERADWLRSVAQRLRAARGELIAAMVLDAGKRPTEGDAEVSEAIDFAEYYRRNFEALQGLHGLALAPGGITLVTPPWNFPLAIGAGGVLAALMAGNAVILKPALETAYVGRRFAELCWEAGVPEPWLQLVVCEDAQASALVSDVRVQKLLLTGASATARMFHTLRPGLDLMAETGGKNALIVTAKADREQAIADVVASAFGHAGQKCSAASLLVCEAEVYDDPEFQRTLRDAAASLPVGSAWEPASRITPLIRPPEGALKRALRMLDPGEQWLLRPHATPDNPQLISPGIRLGVHEGNFCHRTELFGPLLGVMRAADLNHALRLVNGTPYGLTSGLHSLDEREQARWLERVRAGNLYLNRGITGAIVSRQPFGGHKESSFGPGAKAGGPNYLAQLCALRAGTGLAAPTVQPMAEVRPLLDTAARSLQPAEHAQLVTAASHYAQAFQHHFGLLHMTAELPGESNELRYLPVGDVLVRVASDGDFLDGLRACLAATTACNRARLSVDPGVRVPERLRTQLGVHIELADAAALRVADAHLARVRMIGSLEAGVAEAASAHGIHVVAGPVLELGRIELLHYVREQSISHRYHRHGHLGAGQLRPRAAPLGGEPSLPRPLRESLAPSPRPPRRPR